MILSKKDLKNFLNTLHINTKNILSYFKTIGIVFILIFILITFVMLYSGAKVKSEMNYQKQTQKIEYYLVGVMIERYEYLKNKYPSDYKINLRLGYLYNIDENYTLAEQEYKKAMIKAPVNQFRPHYLLARLYVRNDEIKKAQELMDSIAERPDKKLIDYKGEIYERIGSNLYDKGQYYQSLEKFNKAIYYYSKLNKNNKKVDNVRLEKVSALTHLADELVNQGRIDAALLFLHQALKLEDSVIIKYKIGVLTAEAKPLESLKYLSQVYKEKPEMLDFNVYYKLLKRVARTYNQQNNKNMANLYNAKAEEYKEYIANNLIYKNDLEISIENVKLKKDKQQKKYIIEFKTRLKNNSNFDIYRLTLEFDFLTANNKPFYKYTQEVFNGLSYLPAKSQTREVKAQIEIPINDNNKKHLSSVIEIYGYKNKKFKQLIGVYNLDSFKIESSK